MIDSIHPTNKPIQPLLAHLLQNLSRVHADRPDLILASWSELVGEEFASMTKAVSFFDGVLTVKVNNSSLHSVLVQYERGKLLHKLRQKFPRVGIRNISFRIG